MKNKNNKLTLRLKIVVALFVLSVIGLGTNLYFSLSMGINEMVMNDSVLVFVYMLIIFGLLYLKKWAYYLGLLDGIASLAKSAIVAPAFFEMISSLDFVAEGEISFGRVAILGLIPVIITLYIVFVLYSERKKFQD